MGLEGSDYSMKLNDEKDLISQHIIKTEDYISLLKSQIKQLQTDIQILNDGFSNLIKSNSKEITEFECIEKENNILELKNISEKIYELLKDVYKSKVPPSDYLFNKIEHKDVTFRDLQNASNIRISKSKPVHYGSSVNNYTGNLNIVDNKTISQVSKNNFNHKENKMEKGNRLVSDKLINKKPIKESNITISKDTNNKNHNHKKSNSSFSFLRWK